MAIAFDAVTEGFGGSGATHTVAHTCAGSNRILFVGLRYFEGGGTDNITGVTYNSVAMTKVNSVKNDNNFWTAMFMLVNPATGSNNVVASYSPNASTSDMVIVSYTGVAQTGQPDAQASYNTGTVTSYASAITTVANNSWVICWNSGNRNPNAGANSTARSTDNVGGGVMYEYSSNPKTPAGALTMTQTFTSGVNTTNIVSFSPASAVASNLLLLGVG